MKKNCVIAFSSLMLSCALYAQNKRMNVVFIMADDLGLNDTGYTGSDFYETPNIDKLSDDHFQSLVLSISIFVLRLQEGFHIEYQDNFLFENV